MTSLKLTITVVPVVKLSGLSAIFGSIYINSVMIDPMLGGEGSAQQCVYCGRNLTCSVYPIDSTLTNNIFCFNLKASDTTSCVL